MINYDYYAYYLVTKKIVKNKTIQQRHPPKMELMQSL